MSLNIDRTKFYEWVDGLPLDHLFSFQNNLDPIHQFLKANTAEPHIHTGLGWYSFEERRFDPETKSFIPLSKCIAMPKWASAIMWDKDLGADFPKETLLKLHPK